MARYRTALELVTDVRDRADLISSTFRTDEQILRYINESIYSLTGRLLAKYGQDYLHDDDTINTVAGTANYDLPDNCFQVKFFRVTLNNNARVNIPRATTDYLDVDTEDNGWNFLGTRPHHRIQGNKVRFEPTPQAVHAVKVYYYPTLPCEDDGGDPIAELTDEDDKFNGHWGWEQWVVLDAAIKLKNLQEESTTDLIKEKAERWAEIEELADNRITSEPESIRDMYGDGDFPGGARWHGYSRYS